MKAISDSTEAALRDGITSVLSDIANLALVTDRQCYFNHSDIDCASDDEIQERGALEMDRLREVVRRLGCMADIALDRFGGGSVLGGADAWLFSPLSAKKLEAVGRSA